MTVTSFFARAIEATLSLLALILVAPIVVALMAFEWARKFIGWVDLHANYDGDREAQDRDHWRNS